MILAAVIVGVMAARICEAIAASKGRSTSRWALLGCLFGLFAVIAIACLPALDMRPYGYAVPRTGYSGSPRPELNWEKW